jgi:hypothetical protein
MNKDDFTALRHVKFGRSALSRTNRLRLVVLAEIYKKTDGFGFGIAQTAPASQPTKDAVIELLQKADIPLDNLCKALKRPVLARRLRQALGQRKKLSP